MKCIVRYRIPGPLNARSPGIIIFQETGNVSHLKGRSQSASLDVKEVVGWEINDAETVRAEKTLVPQPPIIEILDFDFLTVFW